MHDLAFSKEIINIVQGTMRTLAKGARVTGATVRLSGLSHVKPGGLRETFATMAKKEGLPGLTLTVKALPIIVTCSACKTKTEVTAPLFACPKCAHPHLTIPHTKEFAVESVEIEEA